MDEQMRWLVRLQTANSKMKDIEALKNKLPREIAQITERIEREHQVFAEAQEHLEEIKQRRRKKERDLEAEIEKVNKSQRRLFEVKTNKEYQAMLKEIEAAKEANSALEEEILLLMEEMDECSQELQRREKELSEVEGELTSQRETIRSKLEGLEGESKTWLEERSGVAELVDPSLMAKYERVAQRNGGLAVVRVEKGTCQGCFLSIPPQLYNEILKRGHVVQCPFCMRFIYHESE